MRKRFLTPYSPPEITVTSHKPTVDALALEVFEITKRTWLLGQREKFKGGYDLSESEFLALDSLEKLTSLSVGDLRRRVGVLPAQMSRIIKALEQRYDEKLVLCAINAQDKRKIDVSITPTGRRAVAAYRKAKIHSIIETLQSLPAGDLRNLGCILGKISQASAAHMTQPKA
jgi:DNA-binding MarR family transcriptional regulator